MLSWARIFPSLYSAISSCTAFASMGEKYLVRLLTSPTDTTTPGSERDLFLPWVSFTMWRNFSQKFPADFCSCLIGQNWCPCPLNQWLPRIRDKPDCLARCLSPNGKMWKCTRMFMFYKVTTQLCEVFRAQGTGEWRIILPTWQYCSCWESLAPSGLVTESHGRGWTTELRRTPAKERKGSITNE